MIAMKKRNILTRITDWCPMTPGEKIPDNKHFLSTRNTNWKKVQKLRTGESSNLHEICPKCKKLVKESDLVCPYCNKSLSQNLKCPFCKNPVSDQDTICPNCDNLLIYEQPKKVTAKRNAVLMPLGTLLLISAGLISYMQWKEIQVHGTVKVIMMLLWITGFLFYAVYIGKGDKDFWFGR